MLTVIATLTIGCVFCALILAALDATGCTCDSNQGRKPCTCPREP